MGLTPVDKLVVLKVTLELLNNFDSHLQIVSSVSVDKLTDLLPLVGAFTDNAAVALEEMLHEELVELVGRALTLLCVYLES